MRQVYAALSAVAPPAQQNRKKTDNSHDALSLPALYLTMQLPSSGCGKNIHAAPYKQILPVKNTLLATWQSMSSVAV
jgi:hypothetical protein